MLYPFPSARRLGLIVLLVAAMPLTGCSGEAAKQRHMQAGLRLLEDGKFAEAIIELRNAVSIDERWGEARYKLAEAYEATGDYEMALRHFVRAADLMPDNVTAHLKAAKYLLLVDQFEDARSRIDRALALDPKSVEAHILLGNALAGVKDLDGAVTQITEAIELEPTRGQSYTNLAVLRMAQGQRDAARAAFQRAVTIAPKSIAAWLALANFHWLLGELSPADEALKQAYAIDERSVLTNRVLAAFYSAAGRQAEAEKHLKLVADSSAAPAAKLALADYYIRTSRPNDAQPILEQLKEHDVAAIRLAGIAYTTGEKAEGHRQLDAILARVPNHPAALLMKARWLLSEGRRERALQRTRLAISADARNATAYYIRGLAEAGTHRTADAIKSFSEVLRLNPRASIAQVQLSRLQLARNQVDAAVLYAEEAVANSPGSLDARLALIRAWIARKDFGRAEQHLTALKKMAPQMANVHALDGVLQLERRNTAAAHAAFARALERDPSSLEALTGITTLEVGQGQIVTARARLEARLSAEAADPDLLVLAAKTLIADGNLTRGEELLRRVIDSEPLNPEAYSLLGAIFAVQNRLEPARAEFDAAAANSRDIAPRMMAAMIAHSQGKLDEAKSRYSEVLKLEPMAAVAANNLASIYATQGENLDLAQQLAETAASHLPANAEVLDTLGWILYQRHQVGQAIRHLEQSIALAPENPTFHYHLGLAFSKNGEADRARRAFEQSLKLQPTFPDAERALALIR